MQRFHLQTLEQLPDYLRAFRKLRGLTQAQVAQRLEVTQQVYSSLERRPGKVSVERLYRLAGILGIHIHLVDPGSEGGSPVPVDPSVEW